MSISLSSGVGVGSTVEGPEISLPLNLTGAEATTNLLTGEVAGDTFPAFIINADGKLEFGSGSGAPNVDLFWGGNNILSTSDTFIARADTASQVAITTISGKAGLVFGEAGATNLFETAANFLKTSDAFLAADDIQARHEGSATTAIGAVGPSSEAGIKFGSAGDTILYRSAANNLRTDNNFKVGTGITLIPGGSAIFSGSLELVERVAPTGLANTARLFARDNGEGKTQLMVIFGTGAAQQIAIEP